MIHMQWLCYQLHALLLPTPAVEMSSRTAQHELLCEHIQCKYAHVIISAPTAVTFVARVVLFCSRQLTAGHTFAGGSAPGRQHEMQLQMVMSRQHP